MRKLFETHKPNALPANDNDACCTRRMKILRCDAIMPLSSAGQGASHTGTFATKTLMLPCLDTRLDVGVRQDNRARLIGIATGKLPAQISRLSYPHVSAPADVGLVTVGKLELRAAFQREANEAAEAVRPKAVEDRNWQLLHSIAQAYREHKSYQGLDPSFSLSLCRVVMPLGRARPVLILGLLEELPSILSLGRI